MINFRGVKSGPVTFLRFLSLKAYLTIEIITQDKKIRVRHLLVSKARRRVRRVSMMGKARRREGVQFSRLVFVLIRLYRKYL